MKSGIVVAITASIGVSLSGCGGSGATTTTTTTSGTTTTTTTTTTTVIPPDPRPGQLVADQMNNEYNGYRMNDNTSSSGVYIRAASNVQVFCNTPCFQGTPDCRISGSVLNWRQMLDPKTGFPGGLFGDHTTGWYVNSTMVRTKLSKCTYAWDGATMNKVNFGCGGPQGCAGRQSCCDKSDMKTFNATSYNNKVPPAYSETSGAESPNVKPHLCTNWDRKHQPADGIGAQCFWKGVAFDTKLGDSEDETHIMLDHRLNNSKQDLGPKANGPSMLAWNEMVLDGERLLEAMATDPAGVISAILYTDATHSKKTAQKMANQLQTDWRLTKPVPLIKMQQVDVRSGKAEVFVFEPEDAVLV